ncbi:MAG TPA: serine hydrolase domain-containing protein [Candidatus Acidoferrales bacterium]|nr:serine hydrolase domain-containing protein [Candidatus Acidoferrales bacterium]
MHRCRSILLALLVGFGFALGCVARTGAPAVVDWEAVDSSVDLLIHQEGLVGVSVATASQGQLLMAKGYGKSSLETGAAVTPDTLFAIGSITKQFTAACVLLLAEQGKLSVDDKVSKFFPGLTGANQISLLDLMNHVSGYRDYYPLDFLDPRMLKPISADQLIHDYATRPLDFPPGTRWSYSNTGFIILGRVVEMVSGRPFGQFLRSRILQPLGMTHTLFQPAPGTAGLAEGYTSFALGPPVPAKREADQWLYSAGGLYSTASDLMKWDLALVGGRVLAPRFYRLMTTPRVLSDGRTTRYGCGIAISVNSEGETVLEHTGAVSGFMASNVIVPETQSAVVVLMNSEALEGLRDVQARIIKALFPARSGAPTVSGPPALEAARAMLQSLQEGRVDRSLLGDPYNWFLTDAKLREAAEWLAPLGEPSAAEVARVGERGGMETATIVFTFGSKRVLTMILRSPDGKIQQFLLWPD